jgi:hypothetical protein
MTLEELMALVTEQYQGLKRGLRQNRAKGWPGHTIIEHLMEPAVAVNFAIQEVAYVEQKLAADHPHTNTLYRVMEMVVFPVMAEELTQTVREASPLASEFQETDAFAILGDRLEIGFGNVHSNREKDFLAADFGKRWQIPIEIPEERTQFVPLLAMMEAPLKREKAFNQDMMAAMGPNADEYRSFSWLENEQ